uniref:hypothetical protein n=1 Tax=Ornithobacterium rhinotracheale TaxID=28251 RepID=UPI00129C1407|nr:hypothetical protein [Ornithobacterium rhinotracheale]
MKKYETQEALDRLNAYKRECGSFMRALIEAFFNATPCNRARLVEAFRKEFDEILK